MIKKLHIWIVLILSLIPYLSYATHVVGGSLTYVYNGGSNYTITLKLYRDCGPGTAALPGSVTIQILGNNGQPFTPSKNVTINLTSVTNIAPTLDPCAIPPNPSPCVEEAIYTTTVNNLPPNAGGYHMYFQICCRNGSILNIINPGAAGETFYANIPGMSITTLWNEDFTLPNTTTNDNGITSWSSSINGIAPSSFGVNNNTFQVGGANNAGTTWSSQIVTISSCASTNLSVDLAETGTLEPNDSILVYYRLNGGPLIPFPINGFRADDFGTAFATANGLIGTTIQIVIRVHFDANSSNTETYNFDNISISCIGNDFIPNSDPVFNFFPPLFICVNQPFSFNHSATDANGDSLVYSLYQPYNNPVPTFTNNTVTFTPITYVGGYSSTNPLGAGPFSINSSTGLLTGTPGTLGQFVVGVMVKEYRNGVYIGQTIRDFQFNVLNCPQPPPSLAVPNATINNGCSAKPIATGISSVSATWTSVFPGTPGTYNNYLACTSGCLNNTITAVGSPPPFVDYVVCGISTSCAGTFICDTFRVIFNPTLAVNIFPPNPTLCFGQTSTTITAIGSGGTPPYSYLWNNINPSQTINVGVGTFNIQLSDASGCPPVYNTVAVTAFSVAITAYAGTNQTICAQNPITTINGIVTGASGGVWSGGSGTFLPNNATLANVTYSPSVTELASGFVNLVLTTTGNGTCPLKTDTVKITYVGFIGVTNSTVTNISCFGGTDGSAAINLTGGYAPYTFLWNTSPTQTTSTINNLPIGTYSVTIQDGIGCSTQTNVTVSQPPVLSINSTFKNVTCPGTSTGSISISPIGGTAPYSYSWLPGGQTTSSITSLPAGNYTVNVTDANGCVKSMSLTITQPLPIFITYLQTNVTCFNLSNGTANATANGGTGPFTFSWTPGGATSQSVTGLNAGSYTLTVKDNNNCLVKVTVPITQPSSLTAITSVTNETCNYLNNGAASITPAGGTAPYTYLWVQGNQTTTAITNQASGIYTVTITDTNGCTTTKITTITEPTPLAVNFLNQINVSCFGGNNASISASANGGTPIYTYSWAPGATTSSNLSNVPIGTYTVSVIDNNSCVASNTVIITQPANVVSTNTILNVSCNGLANGSITLATSGGINPYLYAWLPGGQTTSLINGLAAGTYTVNVTDNNGCSKTSTYAVSQPLPLNVVLTQTNVSCFGGNNGAINSSVSGGIAPYTYSWSPGGNTSPNLSGITAATRTLIVKDNNNCSITNTIAISQPAVLVIASSFTNESCNYLDNGAATLTLTGGSSPYSYSWSPGSYTTSAVTGLAAGSYTATATDINGCIKTKVVTINQPIPLNINFINQINVSCFGGSNGSIATSITGGTPNYTYTWSPGNAHTTSLMNAPAGTYTLNLKDIKNCIVQNTITITQPTLALSVSVISQPAICYGASNGSVIASGIGGTPSYNFTWTPSNSVGASLTNLTAGTYSVKVVDSKGCISSKTVEVTQPTQIQPVTSSTNSTCGNANGIGSVTVTGGVAPYSYQWIPSSITSSVATGLLAGLQTVIITDANNCQGSQFLNINDQGGPVASIFSITNVSCFGGNDGSVTAGVIGGLPPINYSWSPFGGTGPTANGLTAGFYYVTVTDANGCVSLATTSPQITEPTPITSNISTSDVSCFAGTNGSATVTASGGNPSYTYTWLPISTNGSSVAGLSANTYSVLVEDQNNCILTSTYSIAQPTAAVSISPTTTSVTCFGGTDGSIDAIATGGTGPYFYNWFPGNYFGHYISNLPTDTYTVNVTDAMGCAETTTITIIEATPIVLTTGSVNSNCSFANGQVSVSATGGTSSYSYIWSPNGGSSAIETGLLAGSYSIEVTDANNCIANATQIVNDNPTPVLTISETSSISCFGGSNASLITNVIGGSGPFTYTWAPSGGNNQTADSLSSNTYSIFVTAANGCTVTTSSNLIPQPIQLFSVISTSNVSCFSGTNGSATVTGGGGTAAYTYSWLPGITTGSLVSNLSAGNYSVQITDANNCVFTSTYSIFQPTAALSASATSTAVLCYGGNNGFANVNTSGGTSPYYYNWLPLNVNSSTISGLAMGTYTINVTDSQNCATTTTVFVAEPTQSLSATANSVPTSCSGGSNGTATITPTGGTGSYTYQWSPLGGTNQTAIGLSPGTYFIDVKDANNCQTNISINVSSPTPVTASLVILNSACNLANGLIKSQVSGGIGPYTYSWSPGAITTSSIGGLLPGTYTLQTFDSFGCINTQTTTLINIPGPAITLVSTANDSCFGDNNGAASITINSGTAPYTTNWLPFGGNTTTANQLTAGIYTASVIDDRGCLNSITTTISEPNPVSISINNVTNVSCFGGNNGSITVSANGGTPAYSYSWLPTNTGSTINNLGSGSYTVNVTDSHLCNTVISINISQPTVALTSTISNVVNLLCHNSSGSATTIASGGTSPYTYTWTTTPTQNGSSAQNILSGTYTVSISDANNCITTNTVTLIQPSTIYSNAGINDTICLGQVGELIASATGGVGNYYYVWQPVNITNTGTLSVGPTSNSNYTVVAFDQNGCAGLPDTAKVVVFTLAASNVQTFGLTPICPGQSSLISAIASGNTGPITYNWSNGLGTGAGPIIVTPTQPITYYVNVINSCGVSILDSVVIAFNPPPIVSAAMAGTIACVPGSLNFIDNSITGNSIDPITTWLWNFGDGTSSSSQNPTHIYNTAGTYAIYLTVTTDGGCTNNSSSTPIYINAYPYPVAQFSVNSTVLNLPYDVLHCTNQSSGANSYNWNFGDEATSSETNPNHSYTNVGIYQIQLIATSQHGCSDTAYAEIKTDADVVFPNAFTPNGDGPSGGYYTTGNLDNDIFFPYTSGVIDYKFQVFNRWGELIFETENIKQGWDGYYRDKICQLGVYVWKAYVKLNNGKVFNLTGDVTLLR